MSVSVFTPNANGETAVTVTAAALQFFQNKLKAQKLPAIHISVKTSGCAGFAYVINYGEKPADTDTEHKFDDITIFISADAMEKIRGSEIDLKVEGLNKNIVFNNPNVTASCGCGTSFSVD